MLEIALDQFPIHKTLNDETPCSIRLMEPVDQSIFCDFHRAIPDEEQLFVKNQIKDGSLFSKWMTNIQDGDRIPLLAFVNGHMAGFGGLQQRLGGWKRHIGKVYFLTHPEYRGLGIIDELIAAVTEVSRHCGLTHLESELNGERESALQSMVSNGFEELVRLPHYIQDMKAINHDYVLMGMDLTTPFENLSAGD